MIDVLRDHAQITITKTVTFGLGNPSMSVPRNGKWTQQDFTCYMIVVIRALAGGPIRRGLTLLTTNEIVGMVEFWTWSLSLILTEFRR